VAKRPPPRTSFRTLPTPPDNPVQVAELAYLERTRRRGSARVLFWLLLLAFGVSVGLGGALYLMGRSGHVSGIELAQRFQTFRGYQEVANAVLSVLILTAGPVLVLETLLLGSDGIAREKRADTWDALVLTRLTAWQIVTGKWRAAQAYVYRRYGGIMTLRALAFLWTILDTSLSRPSDDPMNVPLALVALAVAVTFLALHLALAGASSLLASFQPGPLASFGGAVAVHGMAVMLIVAANVLILRPLVALFGPYSTDATVLMAITPIDAGLIAASQLLMSFSVDRMLTLAAFILANIVLLAALVMGMLALARRLAVRAGAAP
jgi:hypothetical protein